MSADGGASALVRASTVALVAALSLTLLVVAPSDRSFAAELPSWDEVEAARGDADAAEAEARRISGLLDSLEAGAAQLGDEAIRAASEYSRAQGLAEEADAEVDSLVAAAASSAERASEAARQAGAFAASLSRGGDPMVEVFFAGEQSGELLQRLARMSRVSQSASGLRAAAEAEKLQADALARQALVAADERDARAAEAQRNADAAAEAQQAADDQVAALQTASSTLYAQLAVLKNSSAEVEERFRQSQRIEESVAVDPPSAGGGSPAPSPPAEQLETVPPAVGSMTPAEARSYAAGRVFARGWGEGDYQCLVNLWTRESGWRWNAYNASSGAYGIPQSLPGSKMASVAADWRTNAATQIEWGLGYIAGRYGTPCAAWAHSEDIGWY